MLRGLSLRQITYRLPADFAQDSAEQWLNVAGAYIVATGLAIGRGGESDFADSSIHDVKAANTVRFAESGGVADWDPRKARATSAPTWGT